MLELPRDKPVLFLIDGPSQMFRAFFAIRGLSNREGLPTNAVYGFTAMIRKLLKDHEPDFLGVAFDTAAPTFRHEKFEDYKANRPDMPDDLAVQIPYVKEVCHILGAPLLEEDGWEADDLIAGLARLARERGWFTVVVSQDKDLFQLVDESTWVLYASKGEDVFLDEAGVEEKFGVAPHQVADVLALMGDSVDNVPGVQGIGEKGAKALIRGVGSLSALLEQPERAAEIEGLRGAARYAKLLAESVEDAKESYELVHLNHPAPVELDPDRFRCEDPDPKKALEFFRKMQFNRLVEEFSEGSREESGSYHCVTDREQLRKWIQRAKKQGWVAIDTETDSIDPVRATIVGFSLALEANEACYVPLRHQYLDCPKQIPVEQALDDLREIVSNESVVKIGQHIKYDITVLEHAGLSFQGPVQDTMVAAYVLNPTRGSFGLDALAGELLQHKCISYAEVCGTGKNQRAFADVDLDTATEYAAEDADITLRLWKIFEKELTEAPELKQLFEEIEMPLVPILAQMERTGIRLNVNHLHEMSGRLQKEMDSLTKQIHTEAGEPFNIKSPKQLGKILFEKLELPILRKTQKTGAPSTSEAVLEQLAETYELPRMILEYREIQKLKSTYVDALPNLLNPTTGRIHPSYHQTVAATGRLSSSDPNIQNIPIRTELGREVRRAFIPDKGYRFLAADYSQVELRVLAHMADDPKLIDTFRREEDVHTRTAAEVFGVDPEEVTKEMRSRAKAVNFGILYGMGPVGLSQQIGVAFGEAKDFIQRYFDRYPSVQTYIDRTLEQLQETGEVRTLFQRVRRFPQLASAKGPQKSFAERAAINTTIQGTAADLMKLAMIRVDTALSESGSGARILMQIHDELVFEVPEQEIDPTRSLVRNEMEGVYELKVPLSVDVAVGDSWYEV